MQGTKNYDDIMKLPHHQSAVHPHMSMYDRAAQFSPFAALAGHDEAVRETARLTDKESELSEDEKVILDRKLKVVEEAIGTGEVFRFTYFVPDRKKQGGAYVDYEGSPNKIDLIENKLFLTDGTVIEVSHLLEIDGENIDSMA